MLLDARGNPVPTRPTFDEIASAARDDVAGPWVDELRQFQDDILRSLSDGLGAYKKLLTDYQVQSTLQQRFDAVLEKDYEVQPGGTRRRDRMAADFMEEVLEHIKWQNVSRKMLYGIFYGYAVAELLHGRDGQHIFPDEIRVRDRARFRFALREDRGQGGRGRVRGSRSSWWPRLITRQRPRGEDVPPRKFWWFSAGGDHDDDPYGLGLAHYLYWPVYFKRHWTKYALIWGEKWAMPTPIGRYAPGTPQAEQAKLLQTLAAITTDAAVIMPQGMEVDKFEALRQGQGSYEWFLNMMDAAISKIVLSQTMTTDAQAAGLGSSQAEVHEGVRDAVIKSDSKLVDESFSRHPARWYTAWNFPGAAPPIVCRRLDDDEDLGEIAERDSKLFQAGGWVRTPESQRETYGEGYERTGSVGVPADRVLPGDRPSDPSSGGEVDFAERLDEAVAAMALRAGATMFDGMLDSVRQLLAESRSLEEVRRRLAGIFGEMEATALAETLREAMLAAELAGRYEAQEGQ